MVSGQSGKYIYGLVTLERLQLDVCSCVTLNQELKA